MIGNRTCSLHLLVYRTYRSGTVLEFNQFPQSLLLNFQMNILSIYLLYIMSKKAVDNRIKIMVFGIFDGLHEGHLNFFKQAKNFIKNSFLIVSIARDDNVFRIKGYKTKFKDIERRDLVKKCNIVDKVIMAGKKNYLRHILKELPDIIALGYDQKAYVKELKKDLKIKGISIKIIRLKPFKEKIYKNHLLHTRSKSTKIYFTSLSRKVMKNPIKSITLRTKKRYSKEGTKSRIGIAMSGAIIKERG